MSDPTTTGTVGYLARLSTHGLTLFFALSGFLLYRPFATALLSGAEIPSIRAYARNRFLRIYPAYLVIFLLVSFVFGAAYNTDIPPAGSDQAVGYLTDPAAIGLNLILAQTYVPAFLLTGVGTAWSLTAEIAFYVALPCLVLISALLARKFIGQTLCVLLPAGALILLGLVTTVLISIQKRGLTGAAADEFSWGHTWTAVLDRSFLAQADLFGYGMVAAVVVVLLQRRNIATLPSWVKWVVLGTALLVGLGSVWGPLGALQPNGVGVAAALLIIATVLPSHASGPAGNRFARTLEWLPFRYTGLISYSLYLWHLPVILWLQNHGLVFGEDVTGLLANFALVLAITMVLASGTYFAVERPAMQFKKKQNSSKGQPVARKVPVPQPEAS
jgi:peptidoglycan/LPS O-acetylase OafA/YrhL